MATPGEAGLEKMKTALVTLILLLAASFFTSRRLSPPGRAAVFAGYLLLYAFLFPLLAWLPLYLSADFSRRAEYTERFLENIYSSRSGERQSLPLNGDGLIAEEDYKPGTSGKRRLVILGDSFAAGFGLDFEETLGSRLQEQLGSRWQVINGAFFGTNAEMQVEFFFRKLAKYEPASILVRHRMDDVLPLDDWYYLGEAADIMVKYAPHWPRGLKNFFLRRETMLMREKFWKQYRADTAGVLERNMLAHYRRLGEYAAGKGISVLLVPDKCPGGYEAVCEAARSEAARQNWELLDPAEKADLSSPEMLLPDGHPSAAANRLLARLINVRLSERNPGRN